MSTEQTETIPPIAAVEESLAPEAVVVEDKAAEAEAEPASEPAAESTPEPAAEVATAEAKEVASQEILVIEEGYVSKRGPRPLRLWQKRYFRFSDSQKSFPLHNLRYVYRKNVKKAQASVEEFEKTNKLLFETLATATVNASFILAYFKSDDKNEVPQGLINLKHITAVEPAPKIKAFAFIVKTQFRDYVFSTTSQKLTNSWVKTLSDKITADIPDYTETEAYKYSYGQLVGRKGFNAPLAATTNEEPFSASEAEFEPEEITKEASAEVAPEEPVEEANPNGTVKSEAQPDTANTRKSFYNEVIDFFYRKNSDDGTAAEEGEATKQEATEEATKEVAAEEAIEASEETPAVEEAVEEVKVEEEAKASEFSEEIAEMVAPISSDPPALEPTPVTESVEEAPAAATENKPTRAKTFKLPFETKIFSKLFTKGEQKATPEPVKEAEAPVATESTEEVPAESAEAETVTEAAPAVETVEVAEVEAKEVEAEAAVEEATKTEVAVEKPAQEKSHFFSRILSFNKGPKAAPASTVAEPKVEEVAEETQAEAEAEAQPEVAEAEAPVEEQAPLEEVVEPVATEEAAAPKDETKRPFLARLLSGSRKNKTEPPAAEQVAEEAKVEEPVPEAPVEEAAAPTDEAAQETVQEAVAEIASPAVVPLAVETVEEVQITEEAAPLPAPVADEVVPLADETAAEPAKEEVATPSESLASVTATEDSKAEEPKLPFLRRILSGGKKKAEAAPEAPVEPEVAAEEAPAEETPAEVEPTEAPIEEAAAPAEVVEEVEAAPATEEVASEAAVEATSAEEAVPAPARQASLLSKIGGYAYSAVVPGAAAIPEESEEDILEHYTELAKDASHSGFLYKQSVLLHTNNHRFVILSKDGVFTYFRSAHVVSEGKKIAIDDNTTVQPSGELLIVITGPSGTYSFQAKSTEERDAWVSALANFAKKAEAIPEPVVEAVEPAAVAETTEVAEVPEDVVVSQVEEDLTKAAEEAEASK